MVMEDQIRTAKANPTKAFFVSMITRDITLADCILDLIDNSVDSAWKKEGSPPMALDDDTDLSAYRISLTVAPERFYIKDNCGGMLLEDAREHAFSFGKRFSDHTEKYGIGVYGIGMKRAVFKLGQKIRVRSTYTDVEMAKVSFAVPIDVVSWMEKDTPPWDFEITEAEELDENGVEISVDSLTDATKAAFSNPAFFQDLRRTIARDYLIHLSRGLTILVNNESVDELPINLSVSDDFAPIRVDYEDQVNGEEVSVEIIGGMAAPPPESADPDESLDGDKRYGWYIACNGRIVLAADKTSVAGWGVQWQQWHPQYSGFIGVVVFTAANAAALPLTTTKRSIDVSSEVFQRARTRMRDISQEWISYTNNRKQAIEEAKKKESNVRPIPIRAIERKSTLTLPSLAPIQVEQRANVNYSVPISKMKKLAKALGSINMRYRDVGLQSFNYTYDELIEED